MLALLAIVGSFLIFLGTKDLSFALFGILMLLFPVLYDRWKFPERLVFNPKERSILIHKNWLSVKPVLYSDIQELYAEKNSLWSDVSAFREGNRDYIYAFHIREKSGKRHRLLRLQFRGEMDSDVVKIKLFLQALTTLKH